MSWPSTGSPALRLLPESLLASACGYQVLGLAAPAKSRQMFHAPALPSTAVVAVQVSGSKLARIVMVCVLVSVAPQMSAAAWKARSRCWPSVVPALPPTGAAGVGSLKPSPAAFMFWMTMVAAACACRAASDKPRVISAAAAARARRFGSLIFGSLMRMVMLLVEGG